MSDINKKHGRVKREEKQMNRKGGGMEREPVNKGIIVYLEIRY